jgi:hypothetical protein
VLAAALGVLAVGALAVSLVSRDDPTRRDVGWTSYTPVDIERSGANQISVTIPDPDSGGVWDAGLWLGLAIGLGASGVVVLGAGLRARR